MEHESAKMSSTPTLVSATEYAKESSALGDLCYGEEFYESTEIYEENVRRHPSTFFALRLNEQIVGYVVCFPATKTHIQAVNTPLPIPTGKEDRMYIHDMCIHPDHRGKGYAKLLLSRVDEVTRQFGFTKQKLVSVQNSEAAWAKMGFRPKKYFRYGHGAGSDAVLMERILPPLNSQRIHAEKEGHATPVAGL